jgi:hypothetical protein
MIARTDFTDEQWFRLRSAPFQVATAIVEADLSGTLATGRELRAVEEELQRVRYDATENSLVRLVANALNEDLEPDPGEPPADLPTEGSLPDRVVAAMAGLRATLEATVEPSTDEAFRRWLLQIATIAATASKEGFAGITGPTVSDEEQAYLDRLSEALGVD